MGGGLWHVWEMHTEFWWEHPKEKDHVEGTGVYRRIMLKWILKKSVATAWTGLIWLRIRTSGGLL
jgi:hypothetical protein